MHRALHQQIRAVSGHISNPSSGVRGLRSADLFNSVLRHRAELTRAHKITLQGRASIGQRATPSGMPPLAYAVLSAEYSLFDTTDVLITLLAIGADPKDIPEDMWQAPLKSPVKEIPDYQGTCRSATACRRLLERL